MGPMVDVGGSPPRLGNAGVAAPAFTDDTMGDNSHPPTPHGLAVAIASAISLPGTLAILIDRTNRAADFIPIPDAVASGRAYAVRIGMRSDFSTVAFDFDGIGAEQDACDAAALLTRLGIAHVTCRSSSTGRHVLIGPEEPVAEKIVRRLGNSAKRRWPSLDGTLFRNGAAIRPPLAPHRREPVVSEPSCGAEEALRILTEARSGVDVIDKLRRVLEADGARHTVEPLPGCTAYGTAALNRDVVRLGGPRTPRGDGSRDAGHRLAIVRGIATSIGGLVAGGELDRGVAESALVEAAIAVGVPEDEASTTVAEALVEGGTSPRSAPERRAPAQEFASWSAAVRAFAERTWSRWPHTFADWVIDSMRTPAGGLPASRALPVRTGAGATGLDPRTVGRRLQALIDAGLLRRTSVSRAVTRGAQLGLTTSPATSYRAVVPPAAGHDGHDAPLLSRGGNHSPKGGRGVRPVNALTHGGQTVAQLATVTGATPGAIRHQLARWERLGQVTREGMPAHWRWAPGCDAETLAAAQGVGSDTQSAAKLRRRADAARHRLQRAVALSGGTYVRELELAARSTDPDIRAAVIGVAIDARRLPDEAVPIADADGEVVAHVPPAADARVAGDNTVRAGAPPQVLISTSRRKVLVAIADQVDEALADVDVPVAPVVPKGEVA